MATRHKPTAPTASPPSAPPNGPAWLDIMPVIRPLERGLPVVNIYPDMTKGPVTVLDVSEGVQVFIHRGQRTEVWDVEDCRIDLNSAAGFGYALRWRWSVVEYRLRAGDKMLIEGAIIRHLNGETANADRLALARACAEVVR